MSDFFKSALGYFNPGQNGVGAGCADDDFVGQIVEVGTVKLLVKRLIAEGSYALAFECIAFCGWILNVAVALVALLTS